MKNRGFTLIELVITTAIFTIITGGSIASYTQFNQKEKIKTAGLQLETYLRKAQANAIAGVKDKDICGERVLDGWYIDMENGNLYGSCSGIDTVIFASEQFSLFAEVTLVFCDPDNPTTPDDRRSILLFKPLAQGVNQSSIIYLSSSAFGKVYQYKISVSTNGMITNYGFSSSPVDFPDLTPTPTITLTPTTPTPDLTATFIPIAPEDCPVPVASGHQTYFVNTQNQPQIMQVDIEDLDVGIGEEQTVTVKIRDTNGNPITNVGGTVQADNSTSSFSLSLTSGIDTNGVWTGTWTPQDNLCITYGMSIYAISASGQSVVELFFR